MRGPSGPNESTPSPHARGGGGRGHPHRFGAPDRRPPQVVEEHFVDYHHAPRDLFGVTRAGAAPRYDRFPEIVQVCAPRNAWLLDPILIAGV